MGPSRHAPAGLSMLEEAASRYTTKVPALSAAVQEFGEARWRYNRSFNYDRGREDPALWPPVAAAAVRLADQLDLLADQLQSLPAGGSAGG